MAIHNTTEAIVLILLMFVIITYVVMRHCGLPNETNDNKLINTTNTHWSLLRTKPGWC